MPAEENVLSTGTNNEELDSNDVDSSQSSASLSAQMYDHHCRTMPSYLLVNQTRRGINIYVQSHIQFTQTPKPTDKKTYTVAENIFWFEYTGMMLSKLKNTSVVNVLFLSSRITFNTINQMLSAIHNNIVHFYSQVTT